MISIIIPTLNEEENLNNLLLDIKSQTYKDYEIIVADAQSTDGTCTIAEENGCTLVDGGMPAKGRNMGAYIAKGDILLFLDADIRIPSHFLHTSLDEFEQRSLDVAICKMRFTSDKIIYRAFARVYNAVLSFLQYVDPNGSGGNGIIIRKELHEKIKGFNESIRFGEDGEYIRRASKNRRFRMLREIVYTSARRYEEKGIPAMLLFHSKIIYLQFTGQMQKLYNSTYEFDIYKKNKNRTDK
jgi:glycosyltransferase involved in cell wall biosynthesis